MAHLVSKAGFLTFDTDEAELKSTIQSYARYFELCSNFRFLQRYVVLLKNITEKKLILRLFCIPNS